MRTLTRPAITDDAALLHRIAQVTFPLACPPETTVEAKDRFIAEHLSEASFDAYLADPAREIVLAEIDGEAVGYTMLVFADPTDADVLAAVSARPTAELSKCYVLPEHHGAGVAAQLVDDSVRRARARGAAVLWLGVNQFNLRANRFYEKHGFRNVGTKTFLVGDRLENDYVRELLLG